jgi:hypothetical protein
MVLLTAVEEGSQDGPVREIVIAHEIQQNEHGECKNLERVARISEGAVGCA